MSTISYAQNFEDVMLWRALGSVDTGRYIDIGAQDPFVDSVSRMFYEHGWRGVHVEPTPTYAQLLRQSRPDEDVIQAAATNKNGIISFYEFPDTGLSTGDPEIAKRHVGNGFAVREIVVPGLTLDEIFSREHQKEVHWLKIDVEGREGHVLEGWVKSRLRPWILVIESTLPLSTVESHQQWESLVLDKGYRFAYFDGLNRFYIADQHEDLFQAFKFAPNVFDGFVLSGMSTSSFCAGLTSRISALESQIESERRDMERQLLGKEESALEKTRALESAAKQISQESVATRKELEHRLQIIRGEFIELSQRLAEREFKFSVDERGFREELRASQQQIQEFSERLSVRERDFARQIEELQSRGSTELAKLEAEIASARLGLSESIARLNASHSDFAKLSQAFAASEQAFNQRENRLAAELRESRQQYHAIAERLLLQESHLAEVLAQVRSSFAARNADLSTQLEAARRESLDYARQIREVNVSMFSLRAKVELLEDAVRVRDADNRETSRKADAERESLMRSSAALEERLRFVCHEFQGTNSHISDALISATEILQRARLSLEGFGVSSDQQHDDARATSRNPCEASSAQELLSFHGLGFVNNAYRTLLRREPDSNGLRFYLQRIREGISKEQTIAEMALSAEGKARKHNLPGLQKLLRIYRLRNIPLFGHAIQWTLEATRESPNRKRQRACEEEIISLADNVYQCDEHLAQCQAVFSAIHRFTEQSKTGDFYFLSENQLEAKGRNSRFPRDMEAETAGNVLEGIRLENASQTALEIHSELMAALRATKGIHA